MVREAEILSENGAQYVHLPVDFKDPKEADFRKFVEALHEAKDRKVWVHCAANMRVSAFTYRYRVSELGEDEATAKQDLHRIWQPFGVWSEFVNRDV